LQHGLAAATLGAAHSNFSPCHFPFSLRAN